MNSSIPRECLVAIPDFQNDFSFNPYKHKIVEPHEAFVPAFDRSFHFGDSIYEVVRTYQGIPFKLEEHLNRLKLSAKYGFYSKYIDEEYLTSTIYKTIEQFYKKFGNHDIYIRITVSRGYGDLNIDTKYASNPYFLVFVKKLDPLPQKIYTDGIHVSIVNTRRNPPQCLNPAMKSGNYLNNILALEEAKKNGAIEAVIPSMQGFITESTTSNFFIIKDNTVFTAPLDIGILQGITRQVIFELCHENKIKIEEYLFTQDFVLNADELFLSSSTKEIVPITKVDGKSIKDGKPGILTHKLQSLMQNYIKKFIETNKAKSLFLN